LLVALRLPLLLELPPPRELPLQYEPLLPALLFSLPTGGPKVLAPLVLAATFRLPSLAGHAAG
jgi:hypothetical protein